MNVKFVHEQLILTNDDKRYRKRSKEEQNEIDRKYVYSSLVWLLFGFQACEMETVRLFNAKKWDPSPSTSGWSDLSSTRIISSYTEGLASNI